MSSSRDDFSIAFRSALLQRGAAQKFSLFFLIVLALIIFFLDTYQLGFMKPIRSIINDGIYRVSLVASSPSRFFPQATSSVTSLFDIKKENERLKKELEIYKKKVERSFSKELNLIIEEYSTENSVDMIFDKSNILMARKELNITEKIISLFNNQIKEINVR